MAVKMHRVTAFVKVLDDYINDFDACMLNSEVILFVVAFVIDTIEVSQGIESLVLAGQSLNSSVQSWISKVGPESGRIEESAL
tara:strand:- start:1737 stop:1985 length:249 start_codon:yes stop_codon:yes gene_type:complete